MYTFWSSRKSKITDAFVDAVDEVSTIIDDSIESSQANQHTIHSNEEEIEINYKGLC